WKALPTGLTPRRPELEHVDRPRIEVRDRGALHPAVHREPRRRITDRQRRNPVLELERTHIHVELVFRANRRRRRERDPQGRRAAVTTLARDRADSGSI